MGEKIVVGPISKGLRNDVEPFAIDNDSFPLLVNAYQWRGRVKRKRGTTPLCRLQRYVSLDGYSLSGGAINLITELNLEVNSAIVPGLLHIVTSTGNTYTDPSKNGNVVGSPSGAGAILYWSGNLLLYDEDNPTLSGGFYYYPCLPVMGLEEVSIDPTIPTELVAFDTTYAYNIGTNSPFVTNGVSYYNNPATGSYLGYTQKTTFTGLNWNGFDYQQFSTFNYQGALWATNGVQVPFNVSNIGMQFGVITGITVTAGGPPATVNLTIASSGLVVGDFLFINEVVGIVGINFQTGYVIGVSGSTVSVELPSAVLTGSYSSGGIAQYLTNRSNPSLDCIRFYNGPPSNYTDPITFNYGKGWVNFMPPLSSSIYSIADLPEAQYYLVGAKIILAFKDRLLFIGAVIQSSTGNPIYLQDTVIYSQNGTPYYTASFDSSTTGGLPVATTIYQPILVPVNQTAQPTSFWGDQTGLGGWISAGFQSPINTASPNEDVIIMGFGNRQARFVFSGNDLIPFLFFVINSELGSGSTQSIINLDRGVLSVGTRGILMTSQIESTRIDLDIPNQIFEINLLNQGAERITAGRDFTNEWVYFTYNTNDGAQNDIQVVYPNQTLQYNYREKTWAIFNETYTTYGRFRQSNGDTWATIGFTYPTWSAWDEPWDASQTTADQPIVIGGNTQGFVVRRGFGTSECPSLYIEEIDFYSSIITSHNHCLNSGDYITISGVLGTIGSVLNGKVFSVQNVTNDTFTLDPLIPSSSYNYFGSGAITRMYIPFIASKAFPVSWGMSRKTRIGTQMYLLTTTPNSQVTLYIYLSQNYATLPGDNAYNYGPVLPSTGSSNDSLVYTALLYTCPESTNLGLTPANTNLQMIATPGGVPPGTTAQRQIWHRINTSLIGDTVQIGITLSDLQMRDPNMVFQFAEVELHAMILDVAPSSVLA